jgi:tRNA dimethylallyltransferase
LVVSDGSIDAVLLAGPTASGKSALALEIARRVNGVIINADSMQVYRDLRIITARPSAAEEALAPHDLYGHVNAAENYSVGRWVLDAEAAIKAARAAGRLPILIGGTGLYFKAAERGLAAMPAVPAAVREAVRRQAEGRAPQDLHAELAAADPASAERLRATDPQRIIRALEVFAATGRSLTDWQQEPHSAPLIDADRALRIFLAPDRTALYGRIDARFDAMMREGALEEVAALGARGLDPALPSMGAHGVPWLLKSLSGQISAELAIAHAKSDTRHYAKRQFTWFRHQMPGWRFLDPVGAALAVREMLAR